MQRTYSIGMSFFNTVPEKKLLLFIHLDTFHNNKEAEMAVLEWSHMHWPEFYRDGIFSRARLAAASVVLGGYVEM
jgi:hypothetical protein